MDFENWLGTLTAVAVMGGGMLALGRWLRLQTADQLAALKASMDQRFAVVDQRFEAVDQRFEAIDQRLRDNKDEHAKIRQSIQDGIQQVLGLMDRRFQDAGKRMDEMSKRIDDLGNRVDDLRSHVDAVGRAA